MIVMSMIIIMSTVMATHMVMGMDTVVISTITPTAMKAVMLIITAATLSSFRFYS